MATPGIESGSLDGYRERQQLGVIPAAISAYLLAYPSRRCRSGMAILVPLKLECARIAS